MRARRVLLTLGDQRLPIGCSAQIVVLVDVESIIFSWTDWFDGLAVGGDISNLRSARLLLLTACCFLYVIRSLWITIFIVSFDYLGLEHTLRVVGPLMVVRVIRNRAQIKHFTFLLLLLNLLREGAYLVALLVEIFIIFFKVFFSGAAFFHFKFLSYNDNY